MPITWQHLYCELMQRLHIHRVLSEYYDDLEVLIWHGILVPFIGRGTEEEHPSFDDHFKGHTV